MSAQITGLQIVGNNILIDYTTGGGPTPVPTPVPPPGCSPHPGHNPHIFVRIDSNINYPRNHPNSPNKGKVFLTYFCPGMNGTTPSGHCTNTQLIDSKINWLFIGFGSVDWTDGTINKESLLKGDCCNKSGDCFNQQLLDILYNFHRDGGVISLSFGGESRPNPPYQLSSTVIDTMVSSFITLRSTLFTKNGVSFLDGIDLDFEKNEFDGSIKPNSFVEIAKAFKTAGFIVSAAPTAAQFHIGTGESAFPNIFDNLDYFDAIMPQWYQGNCYTTASFHGGDGSIAGMCPQNDWDWNVWEQNTNSYINYFEQYGISAGWSTDCVERGDANQLPQNFIFGQCNNCLKFDNKPLMNKFILGFKTWSNTGRGADRPEDRPDRPEDGVVPVQNIINVLTENPDIGGIGTWAMYHQCGTGDNTVAANFADVIGMNGLDWYTGIGSHMDGL